MLILREDDEDALQETAGWALDASGGREPADQATPMQSSGTALQVDNLSTDDANIYNNSTVVKKQEGLRFIYKGSITSKS